MKTLIEKKWNPSSKTISTLCGILTLCQAGGPYYVRRGGVQSKYWLDVEMASTMLLCILCNNISWVIESSVIWIYKFSNCLLINCWPNSSVSNAFTLVVSDMECGLDTAKLLLKFCFLLIVIKKTSVKFCHHKRQTAKSVYLRLTYCFI